MKAVVITGSTRGIGYGLAQAFLARDCSVTISGRTKETVDEVVKVLSSTHGSGRVMGYPCDVRDKEQLERLWRQSSEHFGRVDIWINNAGIGTATENLWDIPSNTIDSIIDVNLKGLMYGCQVAIRGMSDQGFGFIYNMEGLGSDGRHVDRIATYGTTKRAVAYLTKGLVNELNDSPVNIGSISPGMVITDLLMGDHKPETLEGKKATKIFNILADRVETVTPWLVDKMLINDKNGKRIRWLTTPKIIWRFLTGSITKRNPFPKTS